MRLGWKVLLLAAQICMTGARISIAAANASSGRMTHAALSSRSCVTVCPHQFTLRNLLKIHPAADCVLCSAQPQHTSIGEVAAMAQRLPAPDGNSGGEGGDGQLIHLVLHPPRTNAAAAATGTTPAIPPPASPPGAVAARTAVLVACLVFLFRSSWIQHPWRFGHLWFTQNEISEEPTAGPDMQHVALPTLCGEAP